MASTAKSRSWHYSRAFAAFGLIYSGSECAIETYRARHDIFNAAGAGCTTGAVLAYSGGVKAMCIGCASIAAFSAAIDKFMEG